MTADQTSVELTVGVNVGWDSLMPQLVQKQHAQYAQIVNMTQN